MAFLKKKTMGPKTHTFIKEHQAESDSQKNTLFRDLLVVTYFFNTKKNHTL